MIKEWFTANELTALALPDIPSTKFGILKMASRENWQSRKRIARGGGLEFHTSSLPKSAALAYVEQLVTDKEKLKSSSAQYHKSSAEKPVVFTAEDRRNAKVLIVKLFEKYRGVSGLGILDAEKPFIKFYEAEREARREEFIPAWVYDVFPSFSIQSLRRWRAARRNDDAFNALFDRYGNRKGTGVIETAEGGELKKYIVAIMMKQPHLTAGHIRDLCRAQFGESLKADGKEMDIPHVRTIRRFMADWKAGNPLIHEKLVNPDGYKNKFQPALGRADSSIHALNQLWEIDASPSDVLCCDGRYAIYQIIDVWSRRVIYLVTKTARTEAALLLIRRAMLKWGVPETIRTDNGSDFKSKRFMDALLNLGIEQDICPPYSGDKKAFVERHFRTLQHDLMPIMPGYIGHSVKDRKEIEARRSFAQRLGEDADKSFAVELTHNDLQTMIDRWTDDRYMHRPHSGLGGKTPFERVQTWTAPVRRIENTRALDILLAPVAGGDGTRTVCKKGIRIDNGSYMAGELIPYMGRTVRVRCNPEDMGVIYCFDDAGKFIAEARCFEREGVDPVKAAAEAKAALKEYERTHIDPIRKEAKKITPARIADAWLGQAAKDKGNVTALPMKSEPYETEGLRQAARAASRETAGDELARAQENFEREFLHVPSKIVPDEERWWERACDIEKRIENGESVSTDEQKWLEETAKFQPWYIARSSFEQYKKDQEFNEYAE